MEHIAILSKKEKFLDKIINKSKTIESRWYNSKKTPYKRISAGDTIYFKESGEPVTIKSKVRKAIFIHISSKEDLIKIIKEFGKQICLNENYIDKLKNKKYCTLIFIEQIKKVRPFNINKTGFGNMVAWITIDNIRKIAIKK